MRIPYNFRKEGISCGHADLSSPIDMANLYINSIDIETTNSCVVLHKTDLATILQKAFVEGWRSNHELEHNPNEFKGIDDTRTSIVWGSLESALKKKKGSFSEIIYSTPFLTKEYAMKEFNITEEEFDKLPEKTKEYFSQHYEIY